MIFSKNIKNFKVYLNNTLIPVVSVAKDLGHDLNNNNIIIYPRHIPLSGVPQTLNTSTQPITYHKQPQKTKTKSVHKDKIKHTFNISDIHILRKTPKFTL